MSWVDQPLPLEPLPAPARTSVEGKVRARDGSCCRVCGKQVDSEPAPPVVNVRPKHQGYSVDPELYIAVACLGCAQRIARARVVHELTPGELPWEVRMVLQAMQWIYIQNLHLAENAFRQAVAR